MENRKAGLGLTVLFVLCSIYLLAPVLLVIPLSFSADSIMAFPPEKWGLRWYYALFENRTILDAFLNSLMLGAIVTFFCIIIGLPAAFAFTRLEFRGSELVVNICTAPLLLPSIVLGLAILMIFAPWGWLATWHGLVVGHLVVTLPYALRILMTGLDTLPRDIEEAALTLGASRLHVFWTITLPLLIPAIVGASALSFLVSFDEVVISLFLTGPTMKTLPVEMFNYAEQRADPMVASISTILIALTLLVVAIVGKTVGVAKAFVK